MQIIEIYRSLQGESSFAGLPCTFVRLMGCNLRCSWCDSEYTFQGGVRMAPEEVEAEIRRLTPLPEPAGQPQFGTASALVEITGGEPMLHERELVPLMERLLSRGYTLLLETSGERALARVPEAVHKIVDVKCPQSGEGGSFRMENLHALTARDEVKFVLAGREDYEFARDFVRQHSLEQRVASVLFSPAFSKSAAGTRDASHCVLDPRLLAGWILDDALNVRLGLQIHKFIWDPALKGV